MSNELKPCPFCGGPAIAVDHNGYVESGSPRNFVSCDDPDCLPPPLALMPEKWNTRPIEDALRARVAELEAAGDVLASELDSASQCLVEYGLALNGYGRNHLDAWRKLRGSDTNSDTTLHELR